jgi:hypothetical protein
VKRRTGDRSGFLVADILLGLVLLGVATTFVAVAARQSAAATQRLAQTRAAARLAEEVITSLQAGEPVPSEDGGQVEVERLASPVAFEGFAWARVTVRRDGREVRLVGLVRSGATTMKATTQKSHPREGSK